MLKRALVGGDGGKHLDLARRERETAGEIRKVRFGVDGGIVCGGRGAGCRALRGFRHPISCPFDGCVAVVGARHGVAPGSRRALADRRLTRRDIARRARRAGLLRSVPCDFVAPWTWLQVQHAGSEEQRVDADDQGNQQHDHCHGIRQIDHQQRGCADCDGGHVVERPPHAAPQVGGA